MSRLRPVRGEIDGLEVWSAAQYDGVAREIVTKMKFASAADSRGGRGRADGPDRRSGSRDLLRPCPAFAGTRARSWLRPRLRVARRLITREGRGQTILCLERDDGPRQVGRGREERKSDPPTVRPINASVPLLSDDVWLVDDVATTGATLLACAEVLREQQGAKRVRALTFARADN